MPFIDWDNNGQIDATDVAISIALDNENENNVKIPETKVEPKHGCLTSVAILIICFAILIIAILI